MKLFLVTDSVTKVAFIGTRNHAELHVAATFKSAVGDINRGWYVKGGSVVVTPYGTTNVKGVRPDPIEFAMARAVLKGSL